MCIAHTHLDITVLRGKVPETAKSFFFYRRPDNTDGTHRVKEAEQTTRKQNRHKSPGAYPLPVLPPLILSLDVPTENIPGRVASLGVRMFRL